nr:uncharacterized protein LOC129468805 [Symphalangus syndactylus]
MQTPASWRGSALVAFPLPPHSQGAGEGRRCFIPTRLAAQGGNRLTPSPSPLPRFLSLLPQVEVTSGNNPSLFGGLGERSHEGPGRATGRQARGGAVSLPASGTEGAPAQGGSAIPDAPAGWRWRRAVSRAEAKPRCPVRARTPPLPRAPAPPPGPARCSRRLFSASSCFPVTLLLGKRLFMEQARSLRGWPRTGWGKHSLCSECLRLPISEMPAAQFHGIMASEKLSFIRVQENEYSVNSVRASGFQGTQLAGVISAMALFANNRELALQQPQALWGPHRLCRSPTPEPQKETEQEHTPSSRPRTAAELQDMDS